MYDREMISSKQAYNVEISFIAVDLITTKTEYNIHVVLILSNIS